MDHCLLNDVFEAGQIPLVFAGISTALVLLVNVHRTILAELQANYYWDR